ncbi:hypothetical protein K1719_040021 [Acacia pycnantha]|nr:hypothetical protein K1719_040021 [Acacia pycnantha]
MSYTRSISKELQQWNYETFGSIGRRKRRLLSRIKGLQVRLENPCTDPSDALFNLESSLRDELEDVCFQEELLWLQKSSSEWICLGDRNTHYYHLKALLRRKKNHIIKLKNSAGSWMTDDATLSEHARDFFKTLYSLDDLRSSPLSVTG